MTGYHEAIDAQVKTAKKSQTNEVSGLSESPQRELGISGSPAKHTDEDVVGDSDEGEPKLSEVVTPSATKKHHRTLGW